ncbi:MAG: sulfotransferase [Deltaproteobacteria bacterium]|nr:sulfotransferase [Deltaproteobacteria bacterium]MBN2670821.1 sulfotransferase [Deltaproteobacteria bacterium]
MQENMIFVIGSPRSGSTMMQRMLGSHNDVYTHPEPHIVTPLAHLGFWANVEKAPFDHINASEAIKEYVEELPGKEKDYYDACAAYLDVLYGRMIQKSKKKMMLDKTPAYALVLPFLTRVYPNAKYIVLTRHPLAIFTSYANSFFDGDYDAALAFNDILGRYIPAIANFLREKNVPFIHVKYEDVVSRPEEKMAEIFSFLGLPNQADAVDYGKHDHVVKSYGDPKAGQESRPTTKSVSAWAAELAADSHKLDLARQTVAPLDEDDIGIWGYDKATMFDKVAEVAGQAPKKDKKWKWNTYRMKRKVFMSLRKDIHNKPLGRAVKKVKYYCDVLLRE